MIEPDRHYIIHDHARSYPLPYFLDANHLGTDAHAFVDLEDKAEATVVAAIYRANEILDKMVATL